MSKEGRLMAALLFVFAVIWEEPLCFLSFGGGSRGVDRGPGEIADFVG